MFLTEKRVFIAIDLSDDLIRDLYEAKAKLEVYTKGRWVEPCNMHLTLKFLGKCNAGLINEVISRLDSVCSQFGQFTLEAKGFGCFPSSKRARILWYGLGDHEGLTRLEKAVEEGLAGLGFATEARPFQPHITLARYNMPEKFDIDQINEQIVINGDIPVNYFSLYESRLSPQGARYINLKKFKLLA